MKQLLVILICLSSFGALAQNTTFPKHTKFVGYNYENGNVLSYDGHTLLPIDAENNFWFYTIGGSHGIYLSGKVRIIPKNSSEEPDLYVLKVDNKVETDIIVNVINHKPTYDDMINLGRWQYVERDENFTIKFVDRGEPYDIRVLFSSY